jgi:hypothetical protein
VLIDIFFDKNSFKVGKKEQSNKKEMRGKDKEMEANA